MELQIAELHEKLDRILKILEKKPQSSQLETEWSIENYSEKAVIIKFSFNETFKQSVKDLSGKWMVSKKGWMFPGSDSEKIIKLLSEQYPTWTFTDKR